MTGLRERRAAAGVKRSPRHALKQATQTAHDAAEQRWTAGGAFTSRTTYDAWLTALHGAHLFLGRAAVRTPSTERYAFTEQVRLQAINRDLGLWPTGIPAAPATSEGWAWGVLYALNGSALGASILIKSGAVRPDWPHDYLSEMRLFAASGALKTFFEGLDACDAPLDALIDGANAVFSRLAGP